MGVLIGERKVQRSGGSFWITLPKFWISRNRINNGSTVEVVATKDGLLIRPKEEAQV